MNTSKIIRGVINATKYTVTAPIIKEDYGLYLKIEGLDLPAVYEVDFSNSETSGSSVTMVGNSDGVLIPRQFIKSGQDVFAFLYWNGEDFGRTVYKFRIPNKLRPDRTEEQPTPEEQSLIDQAINALNTAVEQTAADVETTTAKAAEATSAAELASQKASEASASAEGVNVYAERAEAAQTAAESARDTAVASKNLAMTMASEAAGHSESAAASALTASTKAGEASASASAAAQSAIDAREYKDAANLSAESASGYAGAASESATSASESASAATTKASEAAESATTATAKAGEASASATAAQTAQTAAEAAQTAAETAQAASETAAATLENILPTDTASGAVASFPDGTDLFPAKSVVVGIDPVQDLHGYDNPWPAGGGANKWDEIKELGRIDLTTGQPVADNNYYRSVNFCGCIPNTSYYGKASENPSSFVVVFYNENKEFIGYLATANARNVAFTTPENGYFFKIYFSANAINGIAINYPATVTTYSPYSNICPITGWTGAQVVVSPTQDAQDGTTYSVSWQSEAGTVYSGSLDVVNGVLTVDKASVDLGTLAWNYKGTGVAPFYFYVEKKDAKSYMSSEVPKMLCSQYKAYRWEDRSAVNYGIFRAWAMKNGFNIIDPNYTDVQSFTSAMDGVQLVYELAEPIIYHLTPTEVRTLLGQNNVWADTGDSTVEYYADTKRYIDKRIAEIVN